AKLQLAAAGDDIGIGFGAILNADRDVAFRFLQKARANDAALHLVAVAPRERGGADGECHRDGRWIDRLRIEWRGLVWRAERVGDRRLHEARDGNDITGARFRNGLAFQPAEGHDLADPRVFNLAALAAEALYRIVC